MTETVDTVLMSNLEKILNLYNGDLNSLFCSSTHHIEQLRLNFPMEPSKLPFVLRKLQYLDNLIARQMSLLTQTKLLLENSKSNIYFELDLDLVKNSLGASKKARKKVLLPLQKSDILDIALKSSKIK